MNKVIKDIKAIIDDRCEAELGQVHASSKGGKATKTVDTSLIAKDIYNAGYRKVADDDDEIVESMKTYERARQETAREVVKKIIDAGELDFCTALCLDHNKNAVTKRIGRFYADVDKLNEALSEYGIEIKETGATIKE